MRTRTPLVLPLLSLCLALGTAGCGAAGNATPLPPTGTTPPLNGRQAVSVLVPAPRATAFTQEQLDAALVGRDAAGPGWVVDDVAELHARATMSLGPRPAVVPADGSLLDSSLLHVLEPEPVCPPDLRSGPRPVAVAERHLLGPGAEQRARVRVQQFRTVKDAVAAFQASGDEMADCAGSVVTSLETLQVQQWNLLAGGESGFAFRVDAAPRWAPRSQRSGRLVRVEQYLVLVEGTGWGVPAPGNVPALVDAQVARLRERMGPTSR